MREYTLSKTAREIIRERSLDEKIIQNVLFYPDSIDVSAKNPHLFLYQKIYFHDQEEKKRNLILIVTKENEEQVILFVADSTVLDNEVHT